MNVMIRKHLIAFLFVFYVKAFVYFTNRMLVYNKKQYQFEDFIFVVI